MASRIHSIACSIGNYTSPEWVWRSIATLYSLSPLQTANRSAVIITWNYFPNIFEWIRRMNVSFGVFCSLSLRPNKRVYENARRHACVQLWSVSSGSARIKLCVPLIPSLWSTVDWIQWLKEYSVESTGFTQFTPNFYVAIYMINFFRIENAGICIICLCQFEMWRVLWEHKKNNILLSFRYRQQSFMHRRATSPDALTKTKSKKKTIFCCFLW